MVSGLKPYIRLHIQPKNHIQPLQFDIRLNPRFMVSGPKPYIRLQIQLKNQIQPLNIQTKMFSQAYSRTLDYTPEIWFRARNLTSGLKFHLKIKPDPFTYELKLNHTPKVWP